jgi:hypothetical protein
MSCGDGRNRAAIAPINELFVAVFFKFRRAAKIVERIERGVNAFAACAFFYSIDMIMRNGVIDIAPRNAPASNRCETAFKK